MARCPQQISRIDRRSTISAVSMDDPLVESGRKINRETRFRPLTDWRRTSPRGAHSFDKREQMQLCPSAEPACHEHDNQHQENDPAKTPPHCRATYVKTAAAEQQQKNYQQNYEIHTRSLADFDDST